MKMKSFIMIISLLFLAAGCSSFGKTDSGQQSNDSNAQTKGKNSDSLSLKSAYFNHIKVVNGKKTIQNPSNKLALVNKNYFLPSNYIPHDLVQPNVEFSFAEMSLEKRLMRKEAAKSLEKMFTAAKSGGIELVAVSGYRSYSRQKSLFNAEVNRVGEDKAVQAVAVPGSSEHQTGLAMDIGTKATGLELTEGFAKTKEGKWLSVNAHRFGFILRYPKGKENVTIYEYEPWHFRYVGVKAAELIYKHNWTLEEYFHEVKKYKKVTNASEKVKYP